MKGTDEQFVLFATSIAIQLADGLTTEEISELQYFISQISYSLNTLAGCKKIKNLGRT